MASLTAMQIKAQLDTHEAVCAERWQSTITRLKRLEMIMIGFSGAIMILLTTIIIKLI
jgi:hypothetical protein